MTQIINMLIAALYAALFQNLVLTAGYGVSEAIKVAKRPRHLLMCCLSVAYFSFFTAVISYRLEKIPLISAQKAAVHYVLYVLVLSAVYFVTGVFCVKVLRADKKFMNSLGMCAFNSLVLAVPAVNRLANHSVLESLGIAIGAAGAFALAVLLLNAGIRSIHKNSAIPAVFKGTPALLIYVAILSMALSCFSGESLFV